jgi:hypothetical protein
MELENIKDMIPYYLTKEQSEGLMTELEKYSDKTSFYTRAHQTEFLQGDGWKGFQLYDFLTGNKISARGILLSNSCDIDPSNPRQMPAKVTFAPLVKLSKIKALYLSSGQNEKTVDNIINSIKQQHNTQFFFLPAQTVLEEDYVVWLSDIYSMPMQSFIDSASRSKLFTLNLTGFYLFLLKLSIHFCRFHENVDRTDPALH